MEVVSSYQIQDYAQEKIVDLRILKREGVVRGKGRFVKAELVTNNAIPWQISYGDPIEFGFEIEIDEPIKDFEIGIGLFSWSGVEIASALSTHCKTICLEKPGIYKIAFRYRDLELVTHKYGLGLGIRSEFGMEDYIREALTFEVVSNEKSAKYKVDSFGGFVVPQIEVFYLDK